MRLRVAALAIALLGACSTPDEKPKEVTDAASPKYDAAFWKRWPAGEAEVSRYELSGAGQGKAVAIFVKETMANSLRVKSDHGIRAKDDEFPVMRLSLAEEVRTGPGGLKVMLSAFLALAGVNERPAGVPAKVVWSSQDWNGILHKQAMFDREAVRVISHSYFDGEGDQEMRDPSPQAAIASEDTLMMWARGMAWPVLGPGESREVDALASMEVRRTMKGPMQWTKIRLERGKETSKLSVPAGEFVVEKWSAKTNEGRERTYYVESAVPNRIVMYTTGDGREAKLVSSERANTAATN